jgi:hypothetical protein
MRRDQGEGRRQHLIQIHWMNLTSPAQPGKVTKREPLTMPLPTVQAGKADGGFKRYLYRDTRGRYWPCQVLSGPRRARSPSGFPPGCT